LLVFPCDEGEIMQGARYPFDDVLARAEHPQDGFVCRPDGEAHRLELWGHLPPAWAGHLSMHLYTVGVAILSGEAVRTRAGTWAARLLLATREPTDRLSFDFLTMARRGPRMVPTLPRPGVTISSTPSEEIPGSAFVRVRGKDSIGLLAELLRRFTSNDLQPRRFILHTRGDEVDDWFWLVPTWWADQQDKPRDQHQRP
jgi:hypothetical protein